MKKRTVWILAAAIVIVVAGAALLYDRLSAQAEQDPFAGLPAAPTATPAAESIKPEAAETAPLPEGEAPEAASTPAPTPMPAPDFTVTDPEGNPVRLSDFAGKPVILNFWASWCGPCQMEMPAFDEAYAEYGGRIHFLMVNLTDGSRETVETAAAFMEESGYSFPVYYDTEMEAAIAYGVMSIPVTYLIDENGGLVAQAMGALSAEALAAGIGMLLP